jgi:hypothetical protein
VLIVDPWVRPSYLSEQVNVHVYEKERWGGYKRISCFDVDGARRTLHVLYRGRYRLCSLTIFSDYAFTLYSLTILSGYTLSLYSLTILSDCTL